MSFDLFSQDKSSEWLYMQLKDEKKIAWNKEAKEYWNQLYRQLKEFLDKKFSSQFPADIISSLWELTLANYLASLNDKGVRLLKISGKDRKKVPDFCVSIQNKKFYVEAVCAGMGDPSNYSELYVTFDQLCESDKARRIPEQEYRERLSGAFKAKCIDSYVNSGYEACINDDGFIVAISTSKIPWFHQSRRIAVDLSCFFPISPYLSIPIVKHDNNRLKVGNPYHEYQTTFKKKKKDNKEEAVEINTNYFMNEQYSHVSAVLLSYCWQVFYPDVDRYGLAAWQSQYRNDYVLIHNPYAKTPVPQRLLPVSCEIIPQIQDESVTLKIV